MPEFKIRDLMIDILVDDVVLQCRIINSCLNAISNTPEIFCRPVHTCFRYRTPIDCWLQCSKWITRPPFEVQPCARTEIPETIVQLGDTIQYKVDETIVAVDVATLVMTGDIGAVRKQLNMVLDNVEKVRGEKAGELQNEAAKLATSLTHAAEQLRKLGK